MEQNLNILVQSSEYYAPFAGVMLTSLFENNKDISCITVYLMTSDMSEKNRERFQTLAAQYQRTIKFIETKEIDEFLRSNRVPKYNGAYAPYYKIFALSVIEDELDRLIYLDSDMVVTGSLSELLAWDLGQNALGMCIDAIPSRYKKTIKCNSKFYYNTGMIVFDAKKWKESDETSKIISHMKNVRAAYPVVDQDLLNIIFSNQIATVPQKYNFNSGILAYKSYNFWLQAYGIENYYSEEEFLIAKQNPIVLHCMGTFGMRPWCIGEHPAKEIWDQYMSISPWNDFISTKNKVSAVNKVQYVLFKHMPQRIFAAMNRFCFYFSWWKKARKLGL